MTRVRQDYGYLQGKAGKGEKGWTEPDGNGRIAVGIEPAEIKTKEGIFMSEAKKTGHFRLTSQEHYSEAFCTSAFLALSGGFQDAYTYNCRDGVFSNAQTGNIVLMSTYVAKGNWHRALHYLIPVLAFAMGIFIAERLHARFKDVGFIHWRQIIVFTEMVLLCIVGFIPLGGSYDFVANALSSCACAMQVQSFRKVNSYPYASTMCIGNMRSAMESISAYMRIGDKSLLRKSLQYFLTIFVFACGAGIGGAYSLYIGNEFIWISCALLLICFVLMFIKSENDMMREDM